MNKIAVTAGSIAIALVIIVIGGLLAPQAVQACSCAERPEVQQQMKSKAAIFAGTVVFTKKKAEIPFVSRSSDSPVQVNFEVSEVWKGHVTNQLTVHTAMSSASCGVEFKDGQQYLVYANAKSGDLQVDSCGGTMLLAQAGADLSLLGGGSVPPVLQMPPKQSSSIPIIISIVAVLLLAVFIAYAIRRRRTVR
ncbi:hypothetical protein [Paenibacillus radicis (ex Gao et al. 2016)]|uniref:Tissue inhibitor of metalloproteinase n=1 Tax=Paenibacillus radicis (ex Gao et al. 2016) TaxID=1737354 RepID=A0A917M7E7_9BACL|nr:hypothetical protein [Paenibacillus radicis (ex Gao et al. 2016)]GGG79791.1 hypothetical protein GCM10010918_41110 [Paenibacillus radicis (ex Gao et al. 2016)]